MECVHKFTILVATTGVLLSMLDGEINRKGNKPQIFSILET